MTFPHVAMGRDAAGGAQGCAFGKFLADFGDRARSLERAAERIRSAFLERLHFFPPQRDELIFVLHCPREFRQPVSNEQRESEVVAAALCRRIGNASTERGGDSAVSQYSFAKKTESMPYSRASQPGGSGPARLSTWMSTCRRLLRKLTALSSNSSRFFCRIKSAR